MSKFPTRRQLTFISSFSAIYKIVSQYLKSNVQIIHFRRVISNDLISNTSETLKPCTKNLLCAVENVMMESSTTGKFKELKFLEVSHNS